MNEVIINNLQVLLEEARASKEVKDRFRAKAYTKAIKEVKNYKGELTLEKVSELDVGAKIRDKIIEIIKTGSLHGVSSDSFEKTQAIGLFTKIWGVGPVKATELWDLGARSIEDVQKHVDILTDNAIIGLKYYEELQIRQPRKEVEKTAFKISRKILEINPNLKLRVCGSFRRRAETCGDMDILICGAESLQALVEKLKDTGLLQESLGVGKTKYMGICTVAGNAFRIDIELIQPHEWAFALLYFTGSGPFNERQRTIAKKMGYSLSEHGMKDVKSGEYVKGLTSERAIFDFLGMQYLAPWERK